MSQVRKEATVERPLAGIGEILHVLPGLIAMFAVTTIAVIAIQGSESGASNPKTVQVAIIEPVPVEVATPTSISFVSVPPTPPVQVFYLVRTPGQAYEADWGEDSGAMEGHNSGFSSLGRSHIVLFAGTDDEERAAAQIMLEHILLDGRNRFVDVIDLRGLEK